MPVTGTCAHEATIATQLIENMNNLINIIMLHGASRVVVVDVNQAPGPPNTGKTARFCASNNAAIASRQFQAFQGRLVRKVCTCFVDRSFRNVCVNSSLQVILVDCYHILPVII